ncbi:MAG: hypothetical protein R2707_15445 [Acidimicrobiales bacterium]
MRLTRTLLVVVALTVTACTDAGPVADGGPSVRTPTTTLAPTAPPVTVVVQAALPEPITIPGEPTEWVPSGDFPDRGRVDVYLPEDYTRRNDLVLCGHVDDTGLGGCAAAGIGAGGGPIPVGIPFGDGPNASIVLFLEEAEAGWRSLRRLGVYPVDEVFHVTRRLVDGYETLEELLTEPPPPDGQYLEVVP